MKWVFSQVRNPFLEDMALSAKNVKDENSSKERSGCYLAASFREAEGEIFFQFEDVRGQNTGRVF